MRRNTQFLLQTVSHEYGWKLVVAALGDGTLKLQVGCLRLLAFGECHRLVLQAGHWLLLQPGKHLHKSGRRWAARRRRN